MSEVIVCRNGVKSRCSFSSITDAEREANRRNLEKTVMEILSNTVARVGVEETIRLMNHGPHADLIPRRE